MNPTINSYNYYFSIIYLAHYSFAFTHLLCAIFGKYITFLNVTIPSIEHIYIIL